MALLNPHKQSKRVTVSIRLEENLLSEISAYCSWLNLSHVQDFFEQAANYILKHDNQWKKAKTSNDATKTTNMKKT